jgi:hypothetical protein
MSAHIKRSQVAVPEPQRTKQDHARAATAAERKSSEARAEALTWTREHFPDIPEKFHWHLAHCLMRNDYRGVGRSVAAVKRRLASDHPWLVEEIKQAKGES